MRQYSGHFYGPLSMSPVMLIAVDTLSNTAESEKRNDTDQDVMFHCLREYYSLEMLLINHNACHMLKFV